MECGCQQLAGEVGKEFAEFSWVEGLAFRLASSSLTAFAAFFKDCNNDQLSIS